MSKIETFIEEVRKCLARAGEMYNLVDEMRDVQIKVDIRGFRCAGQARGRRTAKGIVYTVRFHPDAVEKHYDEMVADTVPHEVAHIVCFMRPTLGMDHNPGWKKVCRSLGGDDSRTHNMKFGVRPVKPEFWYVTSKGVPCKLSLRHHRAVRAGVTLKLTDKGQHQGVIKNEHFHGIWHPNSSLTLEQAQQAHMIKQPKPVSIRPLNDNAKAAQPSRTVAGSKAARAREYLAEKLASGQTRETMLIDKEIHIDHLYVTLDFGNRAAARSCFLANLDKLA